MPEAGLRQAAKAEAVRRAATGAETRTFLLHGLVVRAVQGRFLKLHHGARRATVEEAREIEAWTQATLQGGTIFSPATNL